MDKQKKFSFPSSIRHSHTLPDGRTLAYYTFAAGVDQSELQTHHPILYFHGFPGSGVEGTICAQAAAAAKCQLFAPDRPGFGSSSPSPAAGWDRPDEYIERFVDDVWDFVKAMKWEKFSVVGVSGGGPFALAVLDSYLKSLLEMHCDRSGSVIPCKLEAVSIVAGMFCTAGVEGMMPQNQQIVSIMSLQGWKSTIIYYFLLLFVGFQRLMLLFVLPERCLMKSTSPFMKDLPEVDQKVFLENADLQVAFLRDVKTSLHQSACSAVVEARVLFREGFYFEQSLRDGWAKLQGSVRKRVPRVSLFHGHLDVNVPLSHSQCVQEQVLGGNSRLVEYPNLGHLSVAVAKADEVMISAAPLS
eukprot:CAMPEP_0197462242 /NCGR_PEP_ID=MMETSP1175-20131217/58579_1 /TAXON_ID=1003142 /ORGANISM="Triceratium dubium, Strain CCMP147" /LENGTH=356 /DNA_ID=CAMNT_0042997681 /DNA_START=106 /DNA_END=1176 /DNA_ORIENTATION=-